MLVSTFMQYQLQSEGIKKVAQFKSFLFDPPRKESVEKI